MEPDDDDVWKAIVDNYGDRPELDPDDVDFPGRGSTGQEPDQGPRSDPRDEHPSRWGRRQAGAAGSGDQRSWDDDFVDSDWTTDRFVPPPPPPLPHLPSDRLAAWAGVFGAPAILLVCLIIGVRPPMPIPYLLVGAFVGGFLYLVLKMSKEPRDPGDDGAVL